MKLEELRDRELININTGEKLGPLGNCDFDIDLSSGKILSIIISKNESFLSFFSKSDDKAFEIPWECIVKIGKDTIMVDV